MLKCEVKTINGYEERHSYTFEELTINDYNNFTSIISRYETKKYQGFITFDIETSRHTNKNQEISKYISFMYIWQVAIDDNNVIMGRTWEQLTTFLHTLATMKENKLVIYVHNLSYEFQFMKNFFEFTDVFATDTHEVLKACTDLLEFRCSYKLSNMSLAKFIENAQGHTLEKGVDDLEYRTLRLPSQSYTMTAKELGYCYNDVGGLYQAITSMLKEDNLNTIKMTSTGFVRRDCYNSCRGKNERKWFKDSKMTLKQYERCKKTFRGGNTASNRFHTNIINYDVGSYDISSSYPYVMLTKKFPCTKWTELKDDEIETFEELDYYNSKYCTVGKYTFINLRLKNADEPIPYLAVSKAEEIGSDYLDYNGRVTVSSYYSTYLTQVDYNIIKNQYEFDELFIDNFMYCQARKLPRKLRETIIDYFTKKSTLKGVEGKEYEYAKSKNKLNSTFGMFVSDIVHDTYEYQETTREIEKKQSNKEEQEKKLQDYYSSRNSFLPYQVGIYITAYARERLQQGIDLVGNDVIYCDTDSIKFLNREINESKFQSLNDEVLKLKEQIKKDNDVAFWVDDKIMGIWDKEEPYKEFVTMGAKKYAFKHYDDKIGVTVSGLNKKKGAIELENGNGLKDFKVGKVFNDSGRTASEFVNVDKPFILTINNEDIVTGSCINIYDVTYTLGMTGRMIDFLANPETFYEMYKNNIVHINENEV